MENNQEIHLDVYRDRSELHYDGDIIVFKEGRQDDEAKQRYQLIKEKLDDGFLEDIYNADTEYDFSGLDDNSMQLLNRLVDGVTSEAGRALVGLTFLQLTIKSIAPVQCIRLHKGGAGGSSFSWVGGISMRVLDKSYNTKFLREKGLLSLNADGIMMTRSLAENYPYSSLYKARMRGSFDTWIKIVDSLENGTMKPKESLYYLMSLLKNRSLKFNELTEKIQKSLDEFSISSFDEVKNLLMSFYENTRYSARAFEVVIHSFMQAFKLLGKTELELGPLTQMRSANKKHGNVGDIELKDGNIIIESWDAKYGKPYLYEELRELKEKLEKNPGVDIAGFIVDKDLKLKREVVERVEDYSSILDVDIRLFNFTDWIDFKTDGLSDNEKNLLAKEWLTAVVESFSRKRTEIAPIDEPCEGWLEDLLALLEG